MKPFKYILSTFFILVFLSSSTSTVTPAVDTITATTTAQPSQETSIPPTGTPRP